MNRFNGPCSNPAGNFFIHQLVFPEKMIAKYKAHIEELAKQLNCRLDIAAKFRVSAMMYVESGYVEVPPIENQLDYLINLHELGHVYWNHTQARPPHNDERFYFDNGVLKSEAQAWEWALDKCLDTLQNASRRFIWEVCLGSYYRHSITCAGKPTRLLNGNRHHVEFVYDKPDEYFTSVVRRIQGDLTAYTIRYNG